MSVLLGSEIYVWWACRWRRVMISLVRFYRVRVVLFMLQAWLFDLVIIILNLEWMWYMIQHGAEDIEARRACITGLRRSDCRCTSARESCPNRVPEPPPHSRRPSDSGIHHSIYCWFAAEVHSEWWSASVWYFHIDRRLRSLHRCTFTVSNRSFGHLFSLESQRCRPQFKLCAGVSGEELHWNLWRWDRQISCASTPWSKWQPHCSYHVIMSMD